MNNVITISIGQAGNQVLNEMLSIDKSLFDNNCFDTNNFLMIDSESKVIENVKCNPNNKILNSNGRGNNWALGYSKTYKEKNKESLYIECMEKFQYILEKSDFINGVNFIHSLFGGTGSGLSCRMIECIKYEFPKFNINDFVIDGFTNEKTPISVYNKVLTIGKIYDIVDNVIVHKNDSFVDNDITDDSINMYLKQKNSFNRINNYFASCIINCVYKEHSLKFKNKSESLDDLMNLLKLKNNSRSYNKKDTLLNLLNNQSFDGKFIDIGKINYGKYNNNINLDKDINKKINLNLTNKQENENKFSMKSYCFMLTSKNIYNL